MESNLESQHDARAVWLRFITGSRALTHGQDTAGLVCGARRRGGAAQVFIQKRYFNDKI